MKPTTFAPLVLLLGACGSRPAAVSAPVHAPRELADSVAVVDGEPVTAAEVKIQAEATGTDARTALGALVDARLLEAEARRRGLADDPSVREAAAREMVRRFLARDFEKTVNADAVTEADIQRAYQKNANQFDHPEINVMLHILAPVAPTAPPEAREAALQRARQVAARAHTVHDVEGFKAIAAALSDDKVKLKGEEVATGRVGWTPATFANAAFALEKVGDTSDVVETRHGYHVLFLKEKIPAVDIPIDKVRDGLRSGLWPEVRRREFGRMVDALVDKHHIETWPAHLDETGATLGEPAK